jgi:Ca2+-binding EF-hand superfamily protein
MFEPYSAFKRMSNHTSGITSLEMREFLDENGLMITRAESHTLMRMFDTDGDGKMSFSEYLNPSPV